MRFRGWPPEWRQSGPTTPSSAASAARRTSSALPSAAGSAPSAQPTAACAGQRLASGRRGPVAARLAPRRRRAVAAGRAAPQPGRPAASRPRPPRPISRWRRDGRGDSPESSSAPARYSSRSPGWQSSAGADARQRVEADAAHLARPQQRDVLLVMPTRVRPARASASLRRQHHVGLTGMGMRPALRRSPRSLPRRAPPRPSPWRWRSAPRRAARRGESSHDRLDDAAGAARRIGQREHHRHHRSAPAARAGAAEQCPGEALEPRPAPRGRTHGPRRALGKQPPQLPQRVQAGADGQQRHRRARAHASSTTMFDARWPSSARARARCPATTRTRNGTASSVAKPSRHSRAHDEHARAPASRAGFGDRIRFRGAVGGLLVTARSAKSFVNSKLCSAPAGLRRRSKPLAPSTPASGLQPEFASWRASSARSVASSQKNSTPSSARNASGVARIQQLVEVLRLGPTADPAQPAVGTALRRQLRRPSPAHAGTAVTCPGPPCVPICARSAPVVEAAFRPRWRGTFHGSRGRRRGSFWRRRHIHADHVRLATPRIASITLASSKGGWQGGVEARASHSPQATLAWRMRDALEGGLRGRRSNCLVPQLWS